MTRDGAVIPGEWGDCDFDNIHCRYSAPVFIVLVLAYNTVHGLEHQAWSSAQFALEVFLVFLSAKTYSNLLYTVSCAFSKNNAVLPSATKTVKIRHLRETWGENTNCARGKTTVHPQNVRFQNVRLQNVRFQNVLFQNVRFTKRQVYKMSGFKTSGFKTSSF